MRLDIKTIRLIYCVCRQAERSVDYTLQTDDGLSALRSYYEDTRLNMVERTIESLSLADSIKRKPIIFSFIANGFIQSILWPFGFFMGWRWFSTEEVIWLNSSLKEFKSMLLAKTPPTIDERIRLRRLLYACQLKLARRSFMGRQLNALGIRTEHLGQNYYRNFESIAELLSHQ